MSDLLGGAVPHLEESLRFRLTRQAALSANVVNADTPGYRRVDISFESALSEASGRLLRTDPHHLPSASQASHRLERGPRGERPDGNGVDLDRELIEMSRNAGAFSDQAAVLTRLLGLRRLALSAER